jgi:hypothetical protein
MGNFAKQMINLYGNKRLAHYFALAINSYAMWISSVLTATSITVVLWKNVGLLTIDVAITLMEKRASTTLVQVIVCQNLRTAGCFAMRPNNFAHTSATFQMVHSTSRPLLTNRVKITMLHVLAALAQNIAVPSKSH